MDQELHCSHGSDDAIDEGRCQERGAGATVPPVKGLRSDLLALVFRADVFEQGDGVASAEEAQHQ